MKEMWNNRYRQKEYAYGIEPNEFFKQSLHKYDVSGSIFLLAEGEGRNAVYAAKQGLEVQAFDISEEGKNKALRLADEMNVAINYAVGDFSESNYPINSFDLCGLIYAHLNPDIRKSYYKKVGDLIKPSGLIILEGFSINNLELKQKNPKIGGPDNIDMLFTTDIIKSDFKDFEIIELHEDAVALNEGIYHNGIGKVVRFIGRKK